jgi:hypothetical protein
MSQHAHEAAVERWLSTLKKALDPLPLEDSREIMAETREHIYERVAAGVLAEDALIGFGSAQVYARAFVDEHMLDSARASKDTVPMLRTVFRFADRSAVAVLSLIGATVAGFFGIWSLICIGVKLVNPALVGLWLDLPLSAQHRYEHSQRDFIPLSFGHDHIVFGLQSPAPHFPEYLGPWIYPVLLAIALSSHLALRAILRAGVKRIRLPTLRSG